MEKLKNLIKNKENILFIISILLCLALMFYWMSKKEGFHEDEIFSYGSSNYIYNCMLKISENDKPIWITPQEASDYVTVSIDEIFNYVAPYANQAQDVHPPLFYFLVHLICSIFVGIFSKYFIFIINAIFFVGICIVIRKIFKLLDKSYLTTPLILLYGLSVGAISTVLFLRMYTMLTFFCLLYLYINLKILKNNFEISKKLAIGLIVTTILGFLTQYYFCIYAVLVFIIMLIKAITYNNKKLALKYFVNHVIAAVIGVLLFTQSINHIFFSYRGVGGDHVKDGLSNFFGLLFGSYSLSLIVGIIILLLCLIYLVVKLINRIKNKTLNKDNLFLWLILIVPAILFVTIVSKLSPFIHLRYVMPIVPIFGLFFILILDDVLKSTRFISKTVIIYIIIVFATIPGMISNKPSGLYTGYNECLEVAEKHKDLHYVYVYDNTFTHLNSVPEFMIYHKSIILNSNNNEIDILKTDNELKLQDSFVLTIKTWLNVDEILNKVLNATGFNHYEKLLNDNNKFESKTFLISK